MSLTEMSLHCKEYRQEVCTSSSLFNTNNVLHSAPPQFYVYFSIERVKTMLKVVLFNVKLLRCLNFHKKDR